MNDKSLDQIAKDLHAIKKLLALLLQSQKVRRDKIAKALGVSGARVSQIVPSRTNKRRKRTTHG